MAGLHKRAWPT